MQRWTVKPDGKLWLVLHNGEEVSRSNSEAGAWESAWRRAITSAQKRGVKASLIGTDICVDGEPLTSANRQAGRRERLTEAANVAGFTTIDKLATAIIAGDVTVSAAGR